MLEEHKNNKRKAQFKKKTEPLDQRQVACLKRYAWNCLNTIISPSQFGSRLLSQPI